MDNYIKTVLTNAIKYEATYTLRAEEDINKKLIKMNTLLNIQKIIDNYDELEPILKKYFIEKAERDKWER